VKALAARLGGIRELVGPKRREELAPLSDAALVKHLAENPGHLRRPLIDTGTALYAGFTAETRALLSK
jgi:arsenate reductase